MKIVFKKIGHKKFIRSLQLSSAILIIALVFYFILFTFAENISFFYSPSEILAFSQSDNADNSRNKRNNRNNSSNNKELRLGGKVSSIVKAEDYISFIISDNKNSIKIKYKGAAPALMQEGIEIVAAGKLIEGEFIAHQILIKHDERYYP